MARTRNLRFVVGLLTAIVAIAVTPVTEARADTAATHSTTKQSDAWISAAADRLSGRRVTVVCAASEPDWAQRLTAAGLPGAADEYYGFTFIHRNEMQLSPYVCDGLRLGMSESGRRANELQVAWSVNVLIHESVHLANFSMDERTTEACARAALPNELHGLYGVAYRSAEMRQLTFASTWLRRTMPAEYQGGSCSARR